MSTLPVAVRAKEGGDLLWFSGEEKRKESVHRPVYRRPVSAGLVAFGDSPSKSGNHSYFFHVDDLLFGNVGVMHVLGRVPAVHIPDGMLIHTFVPETAGLPRTLDNTSSDPFRFSEGLLIQLLDSQADGERRDALSNAQLRAMAVEVTERVEEAIADIGYRWKQRGQGAGHLVSFAVNDLVRWCDDELSKLLVYELNISIVSAASVFNRLFRELFDEVKARPLCGDWGRLVADGDALTLIPAK